MQRYNPKEIEPKWQQAWEDWKVYQATEDPSKPKKYILEYFPYPSGAAMHVGHVRNYTIGDALARYNRMKGYNVLHPMGWDGFGLPAENYAIKNGVSPRQAIDDNTSRFKQQLTQMGFSYDWSRELDSTDPKYYKWTQWLFQLLYRRGLAYQQESLQWWCPVDKTVLANEQVEAGLCWRCGNPVEKKALKQWFFKITDYADRLEKDLDDVNWSDSIKSMQRNWIGRSKGAEITFQIAGYSDDLKVFTTRPDTLYGATFMVLAPEHPLVKHIASDEQREAVEDYVREAQAKSDVQRQETDREKTGVFTGAYAINPANDQHIPIWIADYVLYGYGTGAIMAVPGHDDRDYAFAKKFELPVIEVVEPETGTPQQDPEFRRSIVAIVRNPKTGEILTVDWGNQGGRLFIGGGRDEEEYIVDCAKREIAEETGYTNVQLVSQTGRITHHYYAHSKKVARKIEAYGLLFDLIDESRDEQQLEADEQGKFTVEWVPAAQAAKQVTEELHATVYQLLVKGECYHGEGYMTASGPYDGLPSSEAREKIVADLEIKGVAKEVVNYKIRDWLISRQRYWGAPIPMVWVSGDIDRFYGEVAEVLPKVAVTKTEDGKTYQAVPVPAHHLPVVLPEMDDFQPDGSGRSPLAKAADWMNVWFNIETGETVSRSQPRPDGDRWVEGTRETDTMDGFACSSWYFLRFADPHNDDKAFSDEKVKFWLPVDDYIGGAEHAVMHLLYARMWTKVMQDEGLINFGEPFKTLRNQGMILAPDGNKMSKSKGNTIEPGFLIDQGYGADSIRIMELFIGPWNQSANWSVEGMGGAFRFLQRVWTVTQEYREKLGVVGTVEADSEASALLLKAANRTIKKVDEDFQGLSFNTAIAALMEYVNELYKIKAAHGYLAPEWQYAIESLLQLLAPFAPHITEELWSQLGHEETIHIGGWPEYNEQYLIEDTVTVVAQVNGKVRAQLRIAKDTSQEDVVAAALVEANIKAHTEGKEVVKTIYVPGKLVNFVVR